MNEYNQKTKLVDENFAIIKEIEKIKKCHDTFVSNVLEEYDKVKESIISQEEYTEDLNEDIDLVHDELDDIVKVLGTQHKEIENLWSELDSNHEMKEVYKKEAYEYIDKRITEALKSKKENADTTNRLWRQLYILINNWEIATGHELRETEKRLLVGSVHDLVVLG